MKIIMIVINLFLMLVMTNGFRKGGYGDKHGNLGALAMGIICKLY